MEKQVQKIQTKDTNNIFLMYLILQKVILSLLCLLLFFGWFYWFQYRPLKIKKECWQYTQERIKIDSDEKKIDIDKYTKATDFVYEDCLRMKGLE